MVKRNPHENPLGVTRCVLAVDLGGQHATCALISEQRLRGCETISVDGRAGLRSVLPAIAQSLRRLLRGYSSGSQSCAGIGFSFCGLVDPRESRILATNGKYDDGADVRLADWARQELKLPLRLENDARTALLGERYAGAAQGIDDVVVMTLGTGIGGAAMIGGHLLRGKHFQAGCLGGHFTVNYRGRDCTCGNIGCLEAEASSWSLPSICSAFPLYSESALAALPRIGFKELFQIADAGDRCACEIRDECIRVWSAGAVSLIHAYDPEMIVLGGGVMGAASQILPAIDAYIAQHAWTPWGRVQLRAAALGGQASLFGAVPLLEEVL